MVDTRAILDYMHSGNRSTRTLSIAAPRQMPPAVQLPFAAWVRVLRTFVIHLSKTVLNSHLQRPSLRLGKHLATFVRESFWRTRSSVAT